MNINLRKANRIKEELLAAIKKIDISLTHGFDEHHAPELTLELKRSELKVDIDWKLRLIDTLYTIRQLLAQANFESGVDRVLTEKAMLEKKIEALRAFEDIKKPADLDVIKSKIAALKDRKDSLGYRNMDVIEVVPSQEMLDNYRSQLVEARLLKKQKDDELLRLNVNNEIVLNQDIVDLLKEEGIV